MKASKVEDAKVGAEVVLILYPRRWLILFIFSLITMTNEIIWISLSSVSSIIKNYYQVSYSAVNWLAMVFSLAYLCAGAAMIVLSKFGLKATIVVGALCNTLAAGVRLIGYQRHGYWYALVGTSIGGIGQCFLIFIPPTLAATWFGELERAKASAIGMLMNMFGVAIGYLMGGLFVPNVKDYNGKVKEGMFRTLLVQAVISLVLFISAIVGIKKAPPTPPSISQLHQVMSDSESNEDVQTSYGSTEGVNRRPKESNGFLKDLKDLFWSRTFHLLTQAYGICFGLFASVNTVVNSMCIEHFKGQEKIIGTMGFASVLCGVIAILAAGVWIDRTHQYKRLSLITWLGCVAAFVGFTFALQHSPYFSIVFVCFCCYGICSYPYLSVGLEWAAELMYPVKESLLSFILLFVGCMYGVAFTYLIGHIIEEAGSFAAGLATSGLYLIGTVCVMAIAGELKRLKADGGGGEEGAGNGCGGDGGDDGGGDLHEDSAGDRPPPPTTF